MTMTHKTMTLTWAALVALCFLFYWVSGSPERHPLSNYHKEIRSWGKAVSYVLAPLGSDAEDALGGSAVTGSVHILVRTNVANARVRIMNIGPAYEPRMPLAPGKYDIEVSAPGYRTERRWVTISAENAEPQFTLTSR